MSHGLLESIRAKLQILNANFEWRKKNPRIMMMAIMTDDDGDRDNGKKSLVPACRMSQSHHEGGCAPKKLRSSMKDSFVTLVVAEGLQRLAV